MHTPDEGVGEIAFEIFLRMMTILDSEYSIFMKALYTDEDLAIEEHDIHEELRRKLQELREKIAARMAADCEAMEAEDLMEDDEDPDDFDLDFDLDAEEDDALEDAAF